MFREARYFVEDLGVTAIVALGLVIGLVVGGLATYQLTDGTPYSSSDLDRAGASRPVQVPTAATATVDPALEQRAQQLETRLRDARTRLGTAQQRNANLSAKLADANTALEAANTSLTMAEKTAAKSARTARKQQRQAKPTDMTVGGTLEVTWTLGPEQRPWPASCADVLGRYQVVVDDGSETAAAVADLAGATQTGRTVAGQSLTLACRGTYAVSLTGTADAVFGFSAAARDTPQQALTTVLATTEEIGSGGGPALAVSL